MLPLMLQTAYLSDHTLQVEAADLSQDSGGGLGEAASSSWPRAHRSQAAGRLRDGKQPRLAAFTLNPFRGILSLEMFPNAHL